MRYLLLICAFLTFFSCKKEEKSGVNLELKKELADIWFSDQAFRSMTNKTTGDTIRKLAERMKVDTTYLKKNFKSVQARSDSQNSKRIEEIIKKYGYPGKSLVGTPENETTWIIIQHSSAQMIEKYLPLLRQAKQNGDITAQALALTEDRHLMYQGKAQIYGSQQTQLNGKPIIWPIKNPKTVNALRKEAGFPQTVEEYCNMLGFEYKVYTLVDVEH